MPSVKQLALGDLEREYEITRRILERVPTEHLTWKPHEKSMSLGVLAFHLAGLPTWPLRILTREGFDAGATPPIRPEPSDSAQIRETFDRNVLELKEAFQAATDEHLMETWTFRRGDRVVMSVPRFAAIRAMGISHMIHHRGQLSVYLRLLDIPIPGSYGPSADE